MDKVEINADLVIVCRCSNDVAYYCLLHIQKSIVITVSVSINCRAAKVFADSKFSLSWIAEIRAARVKWSTEMVTLTRQLLLTEPHSSFGNSIVSADSMSAALEAHKWLINHLQPYLTYRNISLDPNCPF